MTIQWPPAGVGWIIALVVLVFAALGLFDVVPASPHLVFAMLLGLAAARLV
jgi:hypothetical protein